MKTLLLIVFSLGVLTLSPTAEAAFFDTLDLRLDAMPASVIVSGNESFSGKTNLGEEFFQYRIVSDPTIRIHKFVLGDLHFYVCDFGVFTAVSDLEALSIYFSFV